MNRPGTSPFIVVCSGCQQTLLVVRRIGDPEVDALHAHLRRCRESGPVSERVALDEVLRRVHVWGFDSQQKC